MRHTLILAATALMAPSLAFAQTGGTAQTQGTQTQSATQPLPAQDFVNKAAIGNLFEIQSSTIARQKAQNDQVRQFAERMILDHTSAGDRMRTAAPDRQFPSSLDPQHEQMLQKLRDTPNDRFDRAYMTIQADAHRNAVDMVDRYVQTGDDNQLKQFAQQILPTLRDHLQTAQQIQGSIGSEQLGSAQDSQPAQPQGEQDRSRIVVQQAAPSVRVDQASPQITVQQAQPTVTVRQPQPDIIVRQPQPTVMINIPQPEITVRMPQPDVNVAMAQPQVRVTQPQPQVQVAQPRQPQVQVERAQPQVQVEGGAAPRVEVQSEGQPSIRFERAEPRVVINQAQGQPKVHFEQPAEQQQQQQEQPKPQTQQNHPTPEAQEQKQTTASQPAQSQEQASKQPTETQPSRQSLAASRLTDMDLYDEGGRQVGDVERIVVGQDGRNHLIIGFGGFLGLGESKVAIPADRVTALGNRLVALGMNEQQIRSLPRVARNQQGYTDISGSQEVQIGEVR